MNGNQIETGASAGIPWTELITFTGIVIVVVLVILLIIYSVFKKGLATKIFFLVIPVMGLSGILGFANGKIGSSPQVIIPFALVGGTMSVITLTALYRMVVKNLSGQIDNLLASVSQLSATAKQSAATASEQASTVTQVTSTVDELNQMSAVTADNAKGVLKASGDAVMRSKSGLDKISQAIRIMEAVSQVSHIVDTVNDLAEQSNLLAVNASIEAAKAGEYGRGFSVVAAEVRNLAEQSKEATTQIREAIGRNEEGRRAIEAVDVVIKDLANVLDEAADKSRQISGAAVQQSAGIKQISEAMQNVAEGGKNTAAAASQLDQAVHTLTKVGAELRCFITGHVERAV